METNRILTIFLLAIFCHFEAQASKQIDKLPKDCGKFSVPTTEFDRIHNGYTAKWGQFPSYARVVAHVSYDAHDKYNGYCGGVVIGPQHIVTAGHCVSDPEYPELVNYVEIRNSEKYYKVHSIEKTCLPKNFRDEKGIQHDLAILKMATPIEFTKEIQPSCLIDRNITEREQVYAVGLGVLREDPSNTFKPRPGLNQDRNMMFEKDDDVPDDLHPDPLHLQVLPMRRTNCAEAQNGEEICFKWNKPNRRGNVCSGDSGSGIYTIAKGKAELVAVINRGSKDAKCAQEPDSYSIGVGTYQARALFEQLLTDCA